MVTHIIFICIDSKIIVPKEPPTLKLTQTLTLTGGQFSSGAIVWIPYVSYIIMLYFISILHVILKKSVWNFCFLKPFCS